MKKNNKDLFIDSYLEHGKITRACKAIGIHPSTFYDWKEKDPDFVKRLKQATQYSNEELTETALTVLKNIVAKGDNKEKLGAIKQIMDFAKSRGWGAEIEQQVEQPTETENKLISGLKSILPNPNQPIQRSNVETDHFGNPKTKDTDAGE